MKRFCGIAFYWGGRGMHISFLPLSRSWETSLYGISIKNTFLGVMVRGKRVDIIS